MHYFAHLLYRVSKAYSGLIAETGCSREQNRYANMLECSATFSEPRSDSIGRTDVYAL